MRAGVRPPEENACNTSYNLRQVTGYVYELPASRNSIATSNR